MFALVITTILASLTGVVCAPLKSGSDIAQDAGLAVAAVVGLVALVALVIVVVLCAGGSGTVIIAGAGIDLGHPPMWTRVLRHDPALSQHGFDGVSDGMRFVTPNIVVRHRTGNFDTDGAKWGFPMTSGKHAFEVTWMSSVRGTQATIGVATESAPMHSKRAVSLVGLTQSSWGVDIVRRRAVYGNVMVDKYPRVPGMRETANIPDRFYVFVDMDAGILSMGCYGEYWGAAHSNLKKVNEPLYLMIGCMKQYAQVEIRYLGSEDKSLHVPTQVAGGNYVIIVNTEAPPQYSLPPEQMQAAGSAHPPPAEIKGLPDYGATADQMKPAPSVSAENIPETDITFVKPATPT